MERGNKNIKYVIDQNLCTGCGMCSNVCPKQCITTELCTKEGAYRTSINLNICINCGFCQKVCPVYTWDNHYENPFVGDYVGIFSGYSLNDTHRIASASGGITTTLLGYLFKKRMIDAAVVAYRKLQSPLECELRIATSMEEVYASKGSVYSPTSYANIIKSIKTSGLSHFAIVGLPCHIEGMQQLCKLDGKLGCKIVFKIALVCGHTPSVKAYEYSLKHLKIKQEDVKGLQNRGEGWPGCMQIDIGRQRVLKIAYGHKYSWGQTLGSPLFTPSGCKHCMDATGYRADISICDAWLAKYSSDTKGRNLLLVRSREVLKILEEMRQKNLVKLTEENVNDFIEANQYVFKEKLYVNAMRSKRHHGVYDGIVFQKIEDVKALFFSHCYLKAEQVLGGLPKNDISLFLLKACKYLALKWIRLRKF